MNHVGLNCKFSVVLVSLFLFAGSVDAQLRITEVMVDSVDDNNWEWIEIQNTSGTPLDLNGFVFDDDDNVSLVSPNIRTEVAGNTVVPANGVAILYRGTALGFDNARFRSAWSLDESTPVIGIENAPGINNDGDAIGLWANINAYNQDLVENADGNLEVGQFSNAIAALNLENEFPIVKDASVYYSGTGDITIGSNWATSMNGENGATTSVATFFDSAQINSTDDVANPGLIPNGTLAEGIHITEIFYNPSSDDDDWEWFEIANGTGSTIDFSATPFFADDDDGSALTEPNVSSGTIENGGVAVLFNADSLTVDHMKQAWGEDANYIGVTAFPGLNNGGDHLGLWNDATAYNADKEADAFNSAIADVDFDDGNTWPNDDGNGSIFLKAVDLDPSTGESWGLSTTQDGISMQADPAFQSQVPDHPGGDVGSPGFVPAGNVGLAGDFNQDGMLDAADIDALTAAVNSQQNDTMFDLDGDADVDADDRAMWVVELKNTFFGDSNLDGQFGTGDLVAVFGAGQYEDGIEGNSTWASGDWNGDGDFSTTDLVFVFAAGGFEEGPRQTAQSVPEPSSIVVLLATFGLVTLRRRR